MELENALLCPAARIVETFKANEAKLYTMYDESIISVCSLVLVSSDFQFTVAALRKAGKLANAMLP